MLYSNGKTWIGFYSGVWTLTICLYWFVKTRTMNWYKYYRWYEFDMFCFATGNASNCINIRWFFVNYIYHTVLYGICSLFHGNIIFIGVYVASTASMFWFTAKKFWPFSDFHSLSCSECGRLCFDVMGGVVFYEYSWVV